MLTKKMTAAWGGGMQQSAWFVTIDAAVMNISIASVTWTTWRRGAGACVASGRTPLLEGVPVAGRAQHDAGPSTHRGYQKRSSIDGLARWNGERHSLFRPTKIQSVTFWETHRENASRPRAVDRVTGLDWTAPLSCTTLRDPLCCFPFGWRRCTSRAASTLHTSKLGRWHGRG